MYNLIFETSVFFFRKLGEGTLFLGEAQMALIHDPTLPTTTV